MTAQVLTLTQAQKQSQAGGWDVIVVGTGMGGGTIGRRLAEQGHSVLFVERGGAGQRAEEHGLNPHIWDEEARLVRGYWPKPMQATVNGTTTLFHAPLGAGVGGSSVFYAAALERPAPHDLDDSPDIPHPTGGWPVSYAEMAPYFAQAEALYHVCGGVDPLAAEVATLPDGPEMSEADVALSAQMQAAGLHPYQGHLALRRFEGSDGYLGRKCPNNAKLDGRSAGVEPALATGRAALLLRAPVTEIQHDQGRVSGVKIRVNGEHAILQAKTYVLAAGALHTPRLLLTSAALGNGSGMVGRNLMFHLNEMFALWPPRQPRPAPSGGVSRALAFRDLYHSGADRFGMVQAMGIEARYGEIVHYLNMAFDRSLLRHLQWLRAFTRLPALVAVKLLGSAKIFVGILEDLPYAQNRVIFDPDNPDHLAIQYEMAPELLARRRAFRRALNTRLRGLRKMFVSTGPELNFGHPCGTVRFGLDPATSVLNRDCRLHEADNLYVVDAGFMPTSMGVNPSLTIAANALRVGDVVSKALRKGEL
ncbi:GMC family oxidoreductase [Shimia sp. R11_0]|uniref:GMC oxidoreductase n=1 Tax=Shimia sp. R11_0 TaxID=2821096 RepID=UPI001ADBF09D|nr:GMC family oxidoreductase [Shimia sp. R11_0]MBO9478695.1 GMC family oxidoreductase [Shimia sp. R11_0]